MREGTGRGVAPAGASLTEIRICQVARYAIRARPVTPPLAGQQARQLIQGRSRPKAAQGGRSRLVPGWRRPATPVTVAAWRATRLCGRKTLADMVLRCEELPATPPPDLAGNS